MRLQGWTSVSVSVRWIILLPPASTSCCEVASAYPFHVFFLPLLQFFFFFFWHYSFNPAQPNPTLPSYLLPPMKIGTGWRWRLSPFATAEGKAYASTPPPPKSTPSLPSANYISYLILSCCCLTTTLAEYMGRRLGSG